MATRAAEIVPPVVELPGTQPQDVPNLESPNKCDNCHGGYDNAVEPTYNWRGSMMAHAGRDPLFWATMAIAEQDFDGAGDLCLRCHSTAGWLAGRSTPTDGSGLAANDADGVDCDYCHSLTAPDDAEHLGVMHAPFIANEPNPNDENMDWEAYRQNDVEGYLGSGMASVLGGATKLGPYDETAAPHDYLLSQFHRDRDFCGTCHDVSNPVVGELAHNHGAMSKAGAIVSGSGAAGDTAAFNNPPYRYGIVERTFSEYKAARIALTRVDDFPSLPRELRGGILRKIYDEATANGTRSADYSNPTAPRYYSCQTCHMRPVTGAGSNKQSTPIRTDLPLHDLVGGNYWMADAIEYLNNAGKLVLGGGMAPALVAAMQAGADRAEEMLEQAATLIVDPRQNTVQIVNNTGHKLITGYPEGRRMWLRIEWYDIYGQHLRVDGEYGILRDAGGKAVRANGVPVRSLLDLQGGNSRIYEAHMGMTQAWAAQLVGLGYAPGMPLAFDRTTGAVTHTLGGLAAAAAGTELETFHFVLNNTVVKDNRIPPYGMDYDIAAARNALPVPVTQYGGKPGGTYRHFDIVSLNPPSGAVYAEIELLYQPTSWEYIQFLQLANDGSVPFLAAEGENMLEAWLATGMAAPHVMAEASWGTEPPECYSPRPTIASLSPGNHAVTVRWQPITVQPPVRAFRVYQTDRPPLRLVQLNCQKADQSDCTSYRHTGLINGEPYCYMVTSITGSCESEFSRAACAIPGSAAQQANAR